MTSNFAFRIYSTATFFAKFRRDHVATTKMLSGSRTNRRDDGDQRLQASGTSGTIVSVVGQGRHTSVTASLPSLALTIDPLLLHFRSSMIFVV